ncbi:MAG: hypothetical protein H0U19_06610 [Acidobacteria bacterium]|nr:hypothetical protein [Acidobacteriota bacterium]
MRNQWVVVGILAGTLFAGDALAQHKTPNQQPPTAPTPTVPMGEVALGSVRLGRGVMADGKALAAGTYQVRVTAQEAKPEAVGTTEPLERWVEFMQRGDVKGREVVSIVPNAEVKQVVKDPPPRSGSHKVQHLVGGDYLRIWVNKAGNHYLIYLPKGAMGMK